MNRNMCYTCIIDSTDTLKEITNKTYGWDYVCVSFDKSITSKSWDVRYVDSIENISFKMPHHKKLFVKILPHLIFKDYERSVYVESYLEINENLNALHMMYCNNSVAVILHPTKNCVYQEFIEIINATEDNDSILEKQIKKYSNEGFPLNYGLYDTRIIYRVHNDNECIALMNEWYSIMQIYSYTDHLSFPYALWKTNFKNSLCTIPPNVFRSLK